MNPALISELLKLGIPERLRLLDGLCDNIVRVAKAVPLTDWQRRELDACLDEWQAAPEDGESWAQTKADILGGR